MQIIIYNQETRDYLESNDSYEDQILFLLKFLTRTGRMLEDIDSCINIILYYSKPVLELHCIWPHKKVFLQILFFKRFGVFALMLHVPSVLNYEVMLTEKKSDLMEFLV